METFLTLAAVATTLVADNAHASNTVTLEPAPTQIAEQAVPSINKTKEEVEATQSAVDAQAEAIKSQQAEAEDAVAGELEKISPAAGGAKDALDEAASEATPIIEQ